MTSNRLAPLVGAVVALAASSACTIRIETRQRYTCEELEAMPQEQVLELARASARRLQGEGKIGAASYRDAAAHAAAVRLIADDLGCDLAAATAESGLIGQSSAALTSGSNYCGPGHSSANPTVSGCLNAACKRHDACYAGCSGPTGFAAGCHWSSATAPCDDAFFAIASTCRWEYGTILNSAGTVALAELVDGFGGATSGCAPDMACPSQPGKGLGSCGIARSSVQCKSCLAVRDSGGACLERECAADPYDNICYAANCSDEVAYCFGQDKTPVELPPPPTGCTPACESGYVCSGSRCVLDESSQWQLTLTRGSTSATDPRDGMAWNLPGGLPDPKVCLGLGLDCSHEEDDTDSPVWNYVYRASSPSIKALVNGLEFSYIDVDLFSDDPICSGKIEFTEADFVSRTKRVECPGDPSSWFELALKPE